MSQSWVTLAPSCDMCGHDLHHDTDCGESTGYDHINGFHECGCPGSLREQLAQAWDEGYQSACDETPMDFTPDGPSEEQNPYR